MEHSSSLQGTIVTFYSYKGGTGRSMALANVACLLSRQLAGTTQRVLVMDWDLEALGLHRFFATKADLPEFETRPGVVNYFHDLDLLLASSPSLYHRLKARGSWEILEAELPLRNYLIQHVVAGVDFMRVGRFDPEYPKLVGSFNWIELFQNYGEVITTFRDLLTSKFRYTLVVLALA